MRQTRYPLSQITYPPKDGWEDGESHDAFSARCYNTRDDINFNLAYWHARDGGGDPDSHIELYCNYCGMQSVLLHSPNSLQSMWKNGEDLRRCDCRTNKKVYAALLNHTESGWRFPHVADDMTSKNTLRCMRGHQRRLSVEKLLEEAEWFPDRKLVCRPCMRRYGTMEIE